jgi:hypothetical protein
MGWQLVYRDQAVAGVGKGLGMVTAGAGKATHEVVKEVTGGIGSALVLYALL